MRYAVAVTPRPHPRVLEARLGDDLALFDLDSRRLHVLNGSAAAIWTHLDASATIGELSVRLGDVYGVSPVDIRPDVERTVERLRADGLLHSETVAPATTPTSADGGLDGRPLVDIPPSGSFAALDARVGVRCDDDELRDTIATVLSPLWCDTPPSVALEIESLDDTHWTVRAGEADPVTLGSRLAVALRAIGEVNNLAVASASGDLVLHAGAVSIGGLGVVLPGGSNHGKSTLTTALVMDGFSYLTDEAAAIDADLHIRPFAKSVALDPGSFPLFPDLSPGEEVEGLARAMASREWHVDPARIGPSSGPAPVVAVICPQWRAGAATRISPVEPLEALHLLLGDTFDFAVGGQSVFARLARLVETVPVVKLSYGETVEAIAAVRSIVTSAG